MKHKKYNSVEKMINENSLREMEEMTPMTTIEVNINNIMRNRELDKIGLQPEDFHSLSGKFSNKDGRVIRIIERGKKKENKKYYAIIGVGLIAVTRISFPFLF